MAKEYLLLVKTFIKSYKPFHFIHRYSIPGGYTKDRSEYVLYCKCGKRQVLKVDYIN